MERDDSAGTDDRTCRICRADLSGYRSDAQTCSDLHRKQWLRLRAKMIDDTSSGTELDNSVSRDVTGAPGPSGMSDIGAAGAASRRLNRARNKARIIPASGQYGVYDMRPPGVIPAGTAGSRAISNELNWARMADDEYR